MKRPKQALKGLLPKSIENLEKIKAIALGLSLEKEKLTLKLLVEIDTPLTKEIVGEIQKAFSNLCPANQIQSV